MKSSFECFEWNLEVDLKHFQRTLLSGGHSKVKFKLNLFFKYK